MDRIHGGCPGAPDTSFSLYSPAVSSALCFALATTSSLASTASYRVYLVTRLGCQTLFIHSLAKFRQQIRYFHYIRGIRFGLRVERGVFRDMAERVRKGVVCLFPSRFFNFLSCSPLFPEVSSDLTPGL